MTFLSAPIYSQDKAEEFVKEGITLHDNGEYDKAIKEYEKALKIEPNSPLVNYEIALTYFSKNEYLKSVQYSDRVIEINDDLLIEAYLTKGSALDMLGETEESIKVFETATKKTEGHYLLFYNLALNYYKKNKLTEAEFNADNALRMNANHASSHLMLANIHQKLGNRVQTLLSAHYFLFLEPDTKRSIEVLNIIHENMKKGVSKDEEKENTINILFDPNKSKRFSSAELMLSLMEASNSTKENIAKDKEELFEENTKTFFSVLGNIDKLEHDDIWDTFYIPFYLDLSKSSHIETYCRYITQAESDISKNWLENNNNKLDEFDKWLRNE